MNANTNTTATRPTTFRLTAEHRETGEVRTLASSKSLARLVERIAKDAEMWDTLGWECCTLEDNTLGTYTPTLLEDLRGRYLRREITSDTWQALRCCC